MAPGPDAVLGLDPLEFGADQLALTGSDDGRQSVLIPSNSGLISWRKGPDMDNTQIGLNPLEFGADQLAYCLDAPSYIAVLIPSNSGLISWPPRSALTAARTVLIPPNSGLISWPAPLPRVTGHKGLNPLEFGADQLASVERGACNLAS